MDHIWSLLCAKTIIDRASGMITIVEATDVLEVVSGQLPDVDLQKPAHIGPISIQLVTFWYRSDIEKAEKGKFRLKLIGPNGKPYGTKENEMTVDLEGRPSSHTVVNIPVIPYVGVGMYYLEMEKSDSSDPHWVRVSRLPLLLRTSTEAT